MQRRGAGEVRVPTRPRGSPCRVRRRAGRLWWAAVVLMGSGAVAIAPAGAAQANDDFTDAIELAGGSGGVNGSTIDATGEPDEPAPESAEPLTSVWYRWTAPRDGTVVFDTCGSGYDTFLAGYTGSAVDDLTVVAANDDACDLQSRISFPVASGEVYRIQVDGWSAATGDFLLTWLLPGRDCSGTACTETFGYLEPGEGQSAVQELSVPEDVCAVSVEAVGARGSGWSAGEGGTVDGGDGGSAVGTVEVSPGDLLEIRVGGPGAGHRGGFNGGGDGSSGRSGGGGGASDVRLGGSDPGDRVIVAGGGGGASSDVGGGDGGGVTGAAGADFDEASGGGGGEQAEAGRGGAGVDGLGGEPGDLDGDGGDGAGAGGGDEDEGGGPAGGGGGGGWRGGGGGGAGPYGGGGGGGGSGFGPLDVQYGVVVADAPPLVRISYDTAAGTCIPDLPPATTVAPPTTGPPPPPPTSTTAPPPPPPTSTVPPTTSTSTSVAPVPPPPPDPGPYGGSPTAPVAGPVGAGAAGPELGTVPTPLPDEADADDLAGDETDDGDGEAAAATSSSLRGGAAGGRGPVEQTSFVQALPTPGEVDWGAGQVGANLFLTLLILVLVAIPSTLVDSTIQENYERIFGGHPRLRQMLVRAEAGLTALPDGVLLVGLSLIAALIFGQLDADLGWNASSAVLVAALALVVAIVVGVHDLARLPYLNRRAGGRAGGLGVYPFALLLAVGLVVVSKVVGFQPGFVFGVVGGLALSETVSDRDDGRSLAAATAGLLAIAFVAWWLWRPVADQVLEADPGAWTLFLDAFLATLWLTALQSVVFGLAPVRFLDGDQVRRWNPWAWLLVWAAAVFLLVQCYLHPSAGRWGGVAANTMRSALSVFAVFLVLGVAFWAWFRFRPAPATTAEEALVGAED